MEMAHRSQKAIGLIIALLALPLAAQELTYVVRHERLLKDQRAELTFTETGLSLRKLEKKPGKAGDVRTSAWPYADIRQLVLSPGKVIVLLYRDRSPWLLGVDKEYELKLEPGADIVPAYGFLKSRLDRRLIAAIADSEAAVTWELPVKRLGLIRGVEGILRFGPDALVFETNAKGRSRTWRMEDISDVSSSDPYELTVTTHERAIVHYGSRKVFHFQLKQAIGPKHLDLLWKRLNEANELTYLKAFQETNEP
jgi:hypothetical protein